MSNDKRIDFEKEVSWIWCEFPNRAKQMDTELAFAMVKLAKSIAERVEEQTIQRIEGLLQHGYVEGQVERYYAQRASEEKGEE